MRKVYNYRRVFRIPYSFRRFGSFLEFKFDIPAVFLANLLGTFLLVLFIWLKIIQKVFPHDFAMWDIFIIVGVPIGIAFLISKVSPDGKNIYRFLWGILVYIVRIKLPNAKYCRDEKLRDANEKLVCFSPLYKVRGGKRIVYTNTNESNSR